jgi:sulfate transport system ATP-binding protein
VFQHYALFRHMTVFENIAFGLRVRPRTERPTGERDQRRGEGPAATSGARRAGCVDTRRSFLVDNSSALRLARALAVQPRVLLLDEPFGALDARVRKQLRQWLRTLHDEVKVTTVLVTHDSEEACEVADRVAVMHEGRIAQMGTAAELGRGAGNPFLESFLGNAESSGSESTITEKNCH